MLKSGNPDDAIKCLERALRIALEHDNQVGEALARGLMAQAHHALGNSAEAVTHAQRAQEIFAECGAEEASEHFEDILGGADEPEE